MADPPRILSLCSGGLGLDLGYECATTGARIVCAVERDPFCVAYMAALVEAGCMDPFPIWDDLRSFDGRPWRGAVDCVTAGFPCQPFSTAGKRRGSDDERHLWPDVLRIIGECESREVFLENVSGLGSVLTIQHIPEIVAHLAALDWAAQTASSIMERWRVEQHRKRLARRLLRQHGIPALWMVVGQLEALGYRVEVEVCSAAEVGASHRRERLFIYGCRGLANCSRGGFGVERDAALARRGGHADGGDERMADPGFGFVPHAGRGPIGRDGAGPAGEILGDSERPLARQGEQGEQGEKGIGRDRPAIAGRLPAVELADSRCERLQGDSEAWAEARAARRGGGAEIPLFAPGPADPRWPGIIHDTPSLEPALRGMAHGMAVARRGWLAMLGNGVVPLQAAFALRVLRDRTRR